MKLSEPLGWSCDTERPADETCALCHQSRKWMQGVGLGRFVCLMCYTEFALRVAKAPLSPLGERFGFVSSKRYAKWLVEKSDNVTYSHNLKTGHYHTLNNEI